MVEAKAGKGSATLSMAYSGARFGNKANCFLLRMAIMLGSFRTRPQVLKGLAGTPTDECAYVASTVTELPYFSSKATPQLPSCCAAELRSERASENADGNCSNAYACTAR